MSGYNFHGEEKKKSWQRETRANKKKLHSWFVCSAQFTPRADFSTGNSSRSRGRDSPQAKCKGMSALFLVYL
jgi:hypothetical protein